MRTTLHSQGVWALPVILLRGRCRYLWMPMFVIGGLYGLMVFLSVFGVWAKQTCTCGCFLCLSSCLSVITMVLEVTVAILTLTVKSKVIKALCEKVQKGSWKPSEEKCVEKSGVGPALGLDDGSGDGSGGGSGDAWHKATEAIDFYEHWSKIIAYVLFGMAFLHLCRTIMGRYVQPDRSELDEPLNSYYSSSSRESVEAMRSRNKFTRSREAALRDGAPMSGGLDESGEVNLEGKSSCVIS